MPARDGSEKITTILEPELWEEVAIAGQILVAANLIKPKSEDLDYPTKYAIGKYACIALVNQLKHELGYEQQERLDKKALSYLTGGNGAEESPDTGELEPIPAD